MSKSKETGEPRFHIERWQALLAAAIASVAAVAVALIQMFGSGSPSPTVDHQTELTRMSDGTTTVTISTFKTVPQAARGAAAPTLKIAGTVERLPTGWNIWVIGKPADQSSWLVSPRADVTTDGQWSVAWQPLRMDDVQWFAVAGGDPAPMCRPHDPCSQPASQQQYLEQAGTSSPLVALSVGLGTPSPG